MPYVEESCGKLWPTNGLGFLKKKITGGCDQGDSVGIGYLDLEKASDKIFYRCLLTEAWDKREDPPML